MRSPDALSPVVPALDSDETDARLWEIVKNLHRNEVVPHEVIEVQVAELIAAWNDVLPEARQLFLLTASAPSLQADLP